MAKSPELFLQKDSSKIFDMVLNLFSEIFEKIFFSNVYFDLVVNIPDSFRER